MMCPFRPLLSSASHGTRPKSKYTAGPPITSFCSTFFCYNVNEGKNQFLAGATICVEFAHSPHVCVDYGYPHIPKMYRWDELVWELSQHEWGWVGVSGSDLQWKDILSSVSTCLTPWAPGIGSSQPWPWTGTSRLGGRGGRFCLFLLMFLKGMDSSHLFQYLRWQAFGVLI